MHQIFTVIHDRIAQWFEIIGLETEIIWAETTVGKIGPHRILVRFHQGFSSRIGVLVVVKPAIGIGTVASAARAYNVVGVPWGNGDVCEIEHDPFGLVSYSD